MKTYYNENDPKAAAWLRELIKAGVIAPGDVDERSICDVKTEDLKPYVQHHFFAGIGGWSLALRLAGWPDSRPCATVSCPCQPFSQAGKGLGEADERHLWPFARNLLVESRAPVVFGEQVASADGRRWLAGVSADLEAAAYPICAANLCAAGVGSPHIRQRLYWFAYDRLGIAECVGQHAGFAGDERTEESAWSTYRTIIDRPSSIGGLSDTTSSRRKRHTSRHGEATEAIEPEEREQQFERCSEACAVHDAISNGRGEGRDGNHGGDERFVADAASQNGGLAHTGHSDRCAQQGFALQERDSRSGQPSPWSDYRIIPFKDGWHRRVESGTFPLVDGFPGRLGLLRGYGNAIVPPLAAQFIKAAVEALKQNPVPS